MRILRLSAVILLFINGLSALQEESGGAIDERMYVESSGKWIVFTVATNRKLKRIPAIHIRRVFFVQSLFLWFW